MTDHLIRLWASWRQYDFPRLVPDARKPPEANLLARLNVSRPFLLKLLEEGKVPCRLVGMHRRIKMADLMTYKDADAAEEVIQHRPRRPTARRRAARAPTPRSIPGR